MQYWHIRTRKTAKFSVNQQFPWEQYGSYWQEANSPAEAFEAAKTLGLNPVEVLNEAQEPIYPPKAAKAHQQAQRQAKEANIPFG